MKNIAEMEAGLTRNIAEWERIFINELIFCILRRIVRDELSRRIAAPNCLAPNCPRRIFCAELAAPNCPAPNCPDTEAEL